MAPHLVHMTMELYISVLVQFICAATAACVSGVDKMLWKGFEPFCSRIIDQ
jgi:hypothetical protein